MARVCRVLAMCLHVEHKGIRAGKYQEGRARSQYGGVWRSVVRRQSTGDGSCQKGELEQEQIYTYEWLYVQEYSNAVVVALVRLIPKSFPSYVDVYEKISEINWETGESLDTWNYEHPMTLRCNVTSLKPDLALEEFSAEYWKTMPVKVELAERVNLNSRIGYLRSSLESGEYFPGSLFNIVNVNTQIDILGNTVCHELYGELVVG